MTHAPRPFGTHPSDDDLERRLRAMFHAATEPVDERPDLFARVERSVEEQRARRRFRQRVMLALAAVTAIVGATFALASDFSTRPDRPGRWHMHWWILELVTTLLLCGVAVALGPLIKRFGKSYAADVFRANPRTGKSYIVLTDVAYYLIFGAYILFTSTFELPSDWRPDTIVGAQIKHEVSRVGGILLIIGALHSANIVLLPVLGRLFTLNRRLDEGGDAPAHPRPPAKADRGTVSSGGGSTWILRIEPGPVDDRSDLDPDPGAAEHTS